MVRTSTASVYYRPAMRVSITTRQPYAPSVEFVERKGTGHPDTICDHLAEELARELASEYLRHTGAVQHFNVDKAILAAGSVHVDFGGGEHVRPSRLVLVGKADHLQEWQPDSEALAERYKAKLLELLPDATAEAFNVEVWLNQGRCVCRLLLSLHTNGGRRGVAASYPLGKCADHHRRALLDRDAPREPLPLCLL